jgi:hypothetical protein
MPTKKTSTTEKVPVNPKRTPGDAKIPPCEHVNKLNGKATIKSGTKLRLNEKTLTEEERKLWADCRREVRHSFKVCLAAYANIGKLLATVRDRRLYRDDYRSFEAYCRKELEIARSTAYNYITDFEVTTELSTCVDTSKLTREIDIRPVTSLQAPERQKVIELLKSKELSEPLTPEMLKKVADEVVSMRTPQPPGANKDGNETVATVPADGETTVPDPATPNLPALRLPSDPAQHGQVLFIYFADLSEQLYTLLTKNPSLSVVVKKSLHLMIGTIWKTATPTQPVCIKPPFVSGGQQP